MATVEAISAPWEGAQAWKIDRSTDERGATYKVDIPGPWDSEPDKIQWVDPDTGLDCLMVRNHFHSWCGYVGVPEGHVAYKADYDEVPVSVHGGLTYGDVCMASDEEDGPSAGICHVPEPGRPEHVYWLGFDCGHAFDFQPGLHAMERRVMPDLLSKYGKTDYDHEAAMSHKDEWHVEKYRTMDYVRTEVCGLAAQLAEVTSLTKRDW